MSGGPVALTSDTNATRYQKRWPLVHFINLCRHLVVISQFIHQEPFKVTCTLCVCVSVCVCLCVWCVCISGVCVCVCMHIRCCVCVCMGVVCMHIRCSQREIRTQNYFHMTPRCHLPFYSHFIASLRWRFQKTSWQEVSQLTECRSKYGIQLSSV